MRASTQALATAAHSANADLLARAAQIAAESSEATRGGVVRELVPPLALLADGLHELQVQLRDAHAAEAAAAAAFAAERAHESTAILSELQRHAGFIETAARDGAIAGLNGLEDRVAGLLTRRSDSVPSVPTPPRVAQPASDETPSGSDRSVAGDDSSSSSLAASQLLRSDGEASFDDARGLVYLAAPLRDGAAMAGTSSYTHKVPTGWTVDPSDLSAGEVVILPRDLPAGGSTGGVRATYDDEDLSVGEVFELLPAMSHVGDNRDEGSLSPAQ